MDRRQLLMATALLPLAAIPISAPKAATNLMWQSWPIGTPRPDEWMAGTTTVARWLKRIREDGPDGWFASCHINNIY